MLAEFRPHMFARGLQQLWPLHPFLFVSSRKKKGCVSPVILIKYPKLGLIGPDWSGLSHVPIHEPIKVTRGVKHDEWLSLINVIQSKWAGSREKEGKMLVQLPEGGWMDMGLLK